MSTPHSILPQDEETLEAENDRLKSNGEQSTLESFERDDGSRHINIYDAIEMLGMGTFQYRIFVAAGLCFMADSVEVLLLTFLSTVLRAQWGLTADQAASITSSVFIGQSIGTIVLGYLGDKVGRKPVFLATATIICFFGFVTSFCNSLASLIVCRFMVGMGVGGITVPFDAFAEFIPSSHRGKKLLLIEYWWSAGTIMVSLLALWTLGETVEETSEDGSSSNNEYGWRWFVVLCSLPCFVSSIGKYYYYFCSSITLARSTSIHKICILPQHDDFAASIIYVPESPVWLLAEGRHEKALQILRNAAIVNGKDPSLLFPPGIVLDTVEDEDDARNYLDLFKPRMRKTTMLLTVVYFGYTISTYSILILVTHIFSTVEKGEDSYSFDYNAILASTPSEILATTIVLLTVDRVGRVPSATVSYAIAGFASFGLCYFASQSYAPRSLLIVFSFLARGGIFSGSCVTWLATAELLPTEVRTAGHSILNAIGRLSAAMSPFLVAPGREYSVSGSIIAVILLAVALASSALKETKGMAMGLVSGSASISIDSAIV